MKTEIPHLFWGIICIWLLACGQNSENPGGSQNGKDSTIQWNDPGIKSNGEIQNRIEGNYLFSIKPIVQGKGDSIIGYLHLDQGKYSYTGQTKSPFRYAFVQQEKGSYTLQFLGKHANSSRGITAREATRVAKIKFEIVAAKDDPVIREFYLIMDENERKVKFGTELEGFQLWRIEKPYADFTD